jgi:hypothetical protein
MRVRELTDDEFAAMAGFRRYNLLRIVGVVVVVQLQIKRQNTTTTSL